MGPQLNLMNASTSKKSVWEKHRDGGDPCFSEVS